jgi:hypothetical protein
MIKLKRLATDCFSVLGEQNESGYKVGSIRNISYSKRCAIMVFVFFDALLFTQAKTYKNDRKCEDVPIVVEN